MSITAQKYDKRQAWGRLYDWDFSEFDEFSLSPAETGLTFGSVTVAPNDGTLTLGTPNVSGEKVQILVSGGSIGVSYTITVNVTTTPHGYALDLDGIINVVA